MTTKSKSIFYSNLLELSQNEELEEAKKEWIFLKEDHSEEKKLCLCNHKLQNIQFYFNKKTHHIVVIGSECSKKFKMKKYFNKFKDLIARYESEFETWF
jgi:hypothetical protein